MRFVALGSVALVAVTVVSACGSAHHGVAVVTPGPTFNRLHPPATSDHYSVRQVEAAFARQGIHLHKDAQLPSPPAPHLVALRYGRRPHFIVVVVRTGPSSTLVVISGRRGSRPIRTRRGNVYAYSDSRELAVVKTALAELP